MATWARFKFKINLDKPRYIEDSFNETSPVILLLINKSIYNSLYAMIKIIKL